MHILGLLTLIVSILYLLDRTGIDIGWLNPFHWHRRRAWSKQYHGDPIYSVEDPLHIAALQTEIRIAFQKSKQIQCWK